MASGDGQGAHPMPQNMTTIPGDEIPDHLPDNLPKVHLHSPPPPTSQVSDSSGYAVADKLLLAAAGAFAGVLLALVALRLYYTSRRRRRRRGLGQRRLLRSLAITGAGGDDDAPSPRGLNPAVLAAIPMVVVVDAGAASAGDCAVCLGGLEPGEKARALPRCGHRFHVECIDAWFRGNATCPLCRAEVVVAGEDRARPEVRIDVAGDDASAAAPTMARLPSGTDRGKARQVFASARFAASF